MDTTVEIKRAFNNRFVVICANEKVDLQTKDDGNGDIDDLLSDCACNTDVFNKNLQKQVTAEGLKKAL